MKHRAKTIGWLVLLISALIASGNGQTILNNTTLSSAMSTSYGQVAVVASATGISGYSTGVQSYLYIDREAMQVVSVNSTTLQVVRGVQGTKAAAHASGAFVFVVPAGVTTQFQTVPQGSCTRTNELYLPRIDFNSGFFSDCLGGQWVNSDTRNSTYPQPNLIRLPDPGATALTALETAGTAPAANTEQYCTELDVPQSIMLTGIAVLNGTTVGTDKHLAILYDSGGKVLANSAIAGTTTSGASTYQKLNFVNKYLAVGPARYFGCIQTNGTTDTLRHAITAVNDNILGGTVTGQTFGTVANVTVPSSFTTAKAPYLAIY